MERRILRPRKEPQKENVQLQPAKRARRAISTIERSNFRAIADVRPVKRSSSSSTQTECFGCCLTATNAQLTQELIAKTRLIEQKDQKYLEFLEMFYLQKEEMVSQISQQHLEIAELKHQIELMQNAPLVEFENNGERSAIIIHSRDRFNW